MDKKDRRLISTWELFSGLSDEETDRLLEYLGAEERSYSAGDHIHRSGTPLEHFGFVLSGVVQVCRDEPDGTRLLMASNGPGDSFGESLCYLRVKEAPVYIVAAQDCRVLWLRMDGVIDPAGDELGREAVSRVMSCFARRALAMNDRIQVLSQRSLRKKIHTLLQQYMRRSGGSTFTIPLSRDDMAVFLGCDRSALSRELARMKEDGLIDYYRNSFKVLR
ncbi:MAG: Crp/Fnr family transcriptional regulator [Firmicutes bacterium]|nr:Crp/Fnr family transcriptional regulator [Bacillota bacterium]